MPNDWLSRQLSEMAFGATTVDFSAHHLLQNALGSRQLHSEPTRMRFVLFLILSCCSTTAFAGDGFFEKDCATLNASQQRLSETSKVQGRYYWIDGQSPVFTRRLDFIIEDKIIYERRSSSSNWTPHPLEYDVSVDGRPLRSNCHLIKGGSSDSVGIEEWVYELRRPTIRMEFTCTILIEKPSNLPLNRKCTSNAPGSGVKTVNVWTYRNDVGPPPQAD